MSIEETMNLRFALDRANEREAEMNEYIQTILADNKQLSEAVTKLTADVERAGACVVAVTELVKVVSQLASQALSKLPEVPDAE